MKVLVTGGRGFIGGHVVDLLLDMDYEPVIFDRQVRFHRDCEVILGDVRDATAVTEAVAHVDGVIHLAAVLGTQETIRIPVPAAETNVLGALNVFHAVAQYGLPCAYAAVGNHWMLNTYSISKTCAERFAWMFNAEHGARIAVVRALNAYGPRQSVAAPFGPSKVRKIMPSFVCRALTGTPIEVYGDGEQIMDMIFVRDVADVLVRAMLNGPHPGGIAYEAGTGRLTTVNEIAGAVIAEVGGGGLHHVPMRPGEPERSTVVGDPETLRPLFGERPELVALEDGVAETVEWFRAHKGVTWDAP
jgi:UDP-glucose 4-epimerase